MVPPPDNTGDEFPDFENMSLEDQLAWLESLAKRQGAGDDELTTSADLDIPTPEDVEIDEPGYVPFEGSRSAREIKEAATVPSPVSEPEPDAGEDEIQAQEEREAEFEESAEAFAAETERDDDPLRWLDSLAAQPEHEATGAIDTHGEGEPEVEEAVHQGVSEQGETEDEMELAGAESVSEVSEHETPSDVETEPEAAGSDDPLGGMDPMLWLESLAARQGADISGFTTAANLQLEDVPEDATVDEPGYVPFEGSRSAREMQQRIPAEHEAGESEEPEEVEAPAGEPAEAAPEYDMEPEPERADLEAGAAVPETEAEELDLVGEDDEAMEWLESLAKRQGASEEEFLTAADIDVPELPDDTVVDEPGYVAYDPLSIRPAGRDSDRSDMASERDTDVGELAEMLEFANGEADEGLSWLEDLAAEPDEDVTAFLALDDESASVPEAEIARDSTAETAPDEEDFAVEDVSEGDDPLAGMTDEEIARAQAEGTLTPQQELAWLKRQARALAEAREAEGAAVESEEIAPAEPGDIPDWLEEIRQTSEDEIVAVADEILDEDDELPDWLQGPEEMPLDDEADAELIELALDEDVDALWEEAADSEQAAADLDMAIPDSELAAFISGDFVPDEVDSLAEALDEEYERRIEGDDEEPEWYTDAVAKVAMEAPPLAESGPGADEEVPDDTEPVLAAAEPADVPGWLAQEIADEAEEAESEAPTADIEDLDEDMPDWLRGADEEDAVPSEDLPGWLVGEDEAETEPALDDVSAWVEREIEPEAAIESHEPAEIEPGPEPATPVLSADIGPEVPVKTVKAPLPEGEAFAEYRARLEANADDHPSRLALARALHANRLPELGLDHYEMLIEAGQLLDDVTADLSEWVTERPDQPRMRRMLGDAYMRQGKLAEALGAYREALHQL